MPHSQRKQQPQSAKGKTDLGLLRFKAEGSQVTIQHHQTVSGNENGNASRQATVPTLRVDLRASKVWVGSAAPLPEGSSAIMGIIGLLRLERGSILAVISKAKRVCGLPDGSVYKVEDTTLIAPETINACENDLRHASLIQEALNPKCFGGHLYFSHTASITSSRQRQVDQDTATRALSVAAATERQAPDGTASLPQRGGDVRPLGPWWEDGWAGAAAATAAAGRGSSGSSRSSGRGSGTTLWSRADPRFLWNRELIRPLIDAGAEAFALPIMAGYVGQATGATFALKEPGAGARAEAQPRDAEESRNADGADVGGGGSGDAEARGPGELTLFTRMGVERPVAGSWRRGADRQGCTAGFAETEVVLTLWQPEERRPAPSGPEAAGGPEGDTAAAAAGGTEAQDATTSLVPGSEDGLLRRRTRVAVASYVMARGSAPLYWAAPPDMRLSPAPRGPEEAVAADKHRLPFAKHVDTLVKAYGKPVLLLNLIFGANRGPQLQLHDALQQQAEAHNTRVLQQAAAASSGLAPCSNDLTAARDSSRAAKDTAAATHAAAGAEGPTRGTRRAVCVVGMTLGRGELVQLASCGAAAERLEQECALGEQEAAAAHRIRPFMSVDEIEATMALPGAPGAAAAAGAAPASSRSRSIACVSRYVHSRQEGVVRVSSASTASAGGCCDEVDLAQHALALPALAEALVALGAMDDVGEMATVHGSVMHALAQLWSHMADVLSDQALGTGSSAGRALRCAAASMEHRGLGALGAWLAEGLVRSPWRQVVAAGDIISRYYYSNFTDARRQDALDLSSGAYKMSYPPAEVPRRQPPNTTFLQLGILLLLAAIIQAVMCAFQRPASLHELGMRVGGPAALGGLLLLDVLRRGSTYVEQPLLRTEAIYPWAD